MPVTGPVLPERYRQREHERANALQDGARTLLCDNRGHFFHHKPVQWARSRAGDANDWRHTTQVPPPPEAQKHPTLIGYEEQQRERLKQTQEKRAKQLEVTTTNSTYGQHYEMHSLAQTDPSSSSSSNASAVAAAALEAATGSAFVSSTTFWAPLESTGKRLGLAVGSTSIDGKKHFVSHTQAAYIAPQTYKDRLTTTIEHFQQTHNPAALTDEQKEEESTQTLRGSTAHSLGYGRRHQFFRHYLNPI